VKKINHGRTGAVLEIKVSDTARVIACAVRIFFFAAVATPYLPASSPQVTFPVAITIVAPSKGKMLRQSIAARTPRDPFSSGLVGFN